jgi:hypothetical protein
VAETVPNRVLDIFMEHRPGSHFGHAMIEEKEWGTKREEVVEAGCPD